MAVTIQPVRSELVIVSPKKCAIGSALIEMFSAIREFMISDTHLFVNENMIISYRLIRICDVLCPLMEDSYKEELIRNLTWGFFVFMTISVVVLLETLLLNKGCSL